MSLIKFCFLSIQSSIIGLPANCLVVHVIVVLHNLAVIGNSLSSLPHTLQVRKQRRWSFPTACTTWVLPSAPARCRSSS